MWIVVEDGKKVPADGRLKRALDWWLKRKAQIDQLERGAVTFNFSCGSMTAEIKEVEHT